MASDKKHYHKVTFYVDDDVKKRLDKLDSRVKSHTINDLLRRGFKRGAKLDDRIDILEALITRLEADVQFDGFAIMALRRVLFNRSGEGFAEELEREFDEIHYSSKGIPPRKNWKGYL